MFTWGPDDLNREQDAALRESRSVLLVACPGSGKTRTLIYKIAYELSRLKSDRQFVVAITYTNRAADEIHERIEGLGIDTDQLWIGTIHAFCLEWILKPYGVYHDDLKMGFTVIDPHESEEILTELCRSYDQPRITYWDCGFYFTPTGYVCTCRRQNRLPNVRAVLSEYFRMLSGRRQIDFELILYCAYQLISERPIISKLLANLFPFLLVDEYQDTKEIQYHIISSLIKAGAGGVSALIVGDPNQSIYQSLGGYPISLTSLNALSGVDFRPLELSSNYRSSERIINYFERFNAYETKIVASSKSKDYPSFVTYDTSTTLDGLHAELVRLIKLNIETYGIKPTEICILAPQWIHLGSMTRKLVASLPQYQFEGPGMVPFSRNVENFWYKLSKIVLTTASPTMYVRRMRWAQDVLREMAGAGVKLTSTTPKTLLRICNSIKLTEADGLKYLREFFSKLFEVLGIDFTVFPLLSEHYVAFFESSEKRIKRLKQEGADFISEIAAFRNVFAERHGITVSTIHGIKGDEYDTVIAYALLDGFVPHFDDGSGPENSRKLLYVVCSRARKNLHLISEAKRFNNRNEEYTATPELIGYQFQYDSV